MFRCNRCRELFDRPDSVKVTENLDGENGWWTYWEEYCPICGSQDFEESAEDETGGEEDDRKQ